MSDSDKSFTFSLTTETRTVNLTVSWSDDEVSHLIVFIVKPYSTLHGVYLVEDLATRELTLDQIDDERPHVLVYGLTVPDVRQTLRMFQVVSSGRVSSCTGSEVSLSLSKTQIPLGSEFFQNLDDLEVSSRYTPPADYKLLPDCSLPDACTTLIYLYRGDTQYLLETPMPASGVKVPFPLPPRQTYGGVLLQTTRTDHDGHKQYQYQRMSKSLILNSVMSKDDLERLKEKAELFVSDPYTHEVKVMFRNKPREKMDDIMENKNGLMEKYIKDRNGDPHSPINNNIDGLFFSVSLDRMTGRIPTSSYYGNRRLDVPVEGLFTANTNIYFTDFYCTYKAHYVTVVMTIKESDTDRFCEATLLQLDPYDNPFLYREGGTVHTTRTLHVEVLYTEDVDITALQDQYGPDRVCFTNTWALGSGKSTKHGLPKNRRCAICNL
ncbi:phytanoyl-CoA hydroxylase-interacting protein-like isoform X2 [Haliotis rufescens]|uniref:phytanoyl-CoA hydroxylase-interacting protein-like isoform X1 n=1 Tax=Haliotis rufescens TaxID=6454 RepID=UPI00201F6D7A|nr:phytanoyl-CoA hydroxylase-interacting protein-like isoform X1 [Haliotis rufescens]XP_046370924.2 phytanoyl-CoA hydroxylase-interacting protein-like isoform X2 [Haliotis rufescens]